MEERLLRNIEAIITFCTKIRFNQPNGLYVVTPPDSSKLRRWDIEEVLEVYGSKSYFMKVVVKFLNTFM